MSRCDENSGDRGVTLSTTETILLSWLKGPVHGRLRCLSGMCTDEAPHTEIDRKVLELDDLVCEMADAMREETP